MLAVMERAFNGGLGVNCTHCYNPEKWSSDEKRPKGVARDMWTMMGTINRELITGISNLKGEKPGINCTTCHRGEVIPALNLPTKQ